MDLRHFLSYLLALFFSFAKNYGFEFFKIDYNNYVYRKRKKEYRMKSNGWKVVALAAVMVLEISGCATKAQTGALTGAAIGGVGGAMLGNSKTAAVGAAAGAVTGAIIGKQLDK